MSQGFGDLLMNCKVWMKFWTRGSISLLLERALRPFLQVPCSTIRSGIEQLELLSDWSTYVSSASWSWWWWQNTWSLLSFEMFFLRLNTFFNYTKAIMILRQHGYRIITFWPMREASIFGEEILMALFFGYKMVLSFWFYSSTGEPFPGSNVLRQNGRRNQRLQFQLCHQKWESKGK